MRRAKIVYGLNIDILHTDAVFYNVGATPAIITGLLVFSLNAVEEHHTAYPRILLWMLILLDFHDGPKPVFTEIGKRTLSGKGRWPMTVLLVLATFAVFALVDYLLNRETATKPAEAHEPARVPPDPEYIEGFSVPRHLRYHPGHAWVSPERKRIVRVGADEFAAALAGKVDGIELPKPGQWIRQGQKAWNFIRGGEKVSMVSPIEGEVVEVNREAAANPAVVRQDPYGTGWIMSVYVPDEESTSRNFVPLTLVKNWAKDAVRRLWALQPQLAGATAPDGGRLYEDPLADLPPAEWKRIASEFFLT